MYILIYTLYKDDLEYRKSFLLKDDMMKFIERNKYVIKDFIVCKQLVFPRKELHY